MQRLTTFAAALLCLAGSAHADVLNNGNFEHGLSGWTYSGHVGLAAPVYFGAGSTARDGTDMVAFNAGDSAPTGVLAQAFATTVGTRYTVSFDYGLTSCSGGCSQSLVVGVFDAGSSSPLAGMTAVATTSGALGAYQFSFVADSSSMGLRFADAPANATNSLDGVLDNVAVDANVPEPATLGLFGLGLLGLGAVARRRSQR